MRNAKTMQFGTAHPALGCIQLIVILLCAVCARAEKSSQTLNTDIKLVVKKHDNMVALDGKMARDFRKRGLKAVAVNVLIENNSAVPIPVYWGSFKIKDQDDQIAEASLFASGPRQYLDLTTVQPFDKIAAWISFEASPGIVMEKSFIRYEQSPNGFSTNSMISDWFPIGGGGK